MTYIVITTDRAERDIEVIFDYIAQRSPEGAGRWFAALVEAQDALRVRPERHGLAPENGRYPSELRQTFFKTKKGNRYRIVYTIQGQHVLIMHVRGQGQDLVE